MNQTSETKRNTKGVAYHVERHKLVSKIAMLRACALTTGKDLQDRITETYRLDDSHATLEEVEASIKEAIAALQAELKCARKLG